MVVLHYRFCFLECFRASTDYYPHSLSPTIPPKKNKSPQKLIALIVAVIAFKMPAGMAVMSAT